MTKRTVSDLEGQYRKQLNFLTRSAEAFDSGFEDEDIRLAQSIRVLFHQTKSSHSILAQLGKEVKLVDSSHPLILGNKLGEMPLVQSGVGGESGSRFFAPLSGAIRKNLIPFENWWNQLVFRNGDALKFSRRRLVLQMANK